MLGRNPPGSAKKGFFQMKCKHSMKETLVVFLVLCTGSLFLNCNREDAKEISLREKKIQPVPLPKEKSLNIAISAMTSPKETFLYYRKILNYISKKINMPVNMVQKGTYAEINELIKDEKIHIAFVCSGAYIDGHEKFGMELLVAPKVYGKPYYYSYIIVPMDSDVRSLKDLKGKKFAFTDPMSNTGKLVPTYLLATMEETPDSFFSDKIFTYSHDKSIKAVAQKLVDGAAVDSLIWDYANVTNPKFTSKTRIIKKSSPYGIPPVVVQKGLLSKTKENLREILLNMHMDTEGKRILDKLHIDKFILVDDSIYNSIREMRKWLDRQR